MAYSKKIKTKKSMLVLSSAISSFAALFFTALMVVKVLVGVVDPTLFIDMLVVFASCLVFSACIKDTMEDAVSKITKEIENGE